MKRIAIALTLVLLAAGASCIKLTRPYKEISYYQIQYDSPKAEGMPHGDVVVRIPSFDVSPSFDRLKIMYSTSALSLKTYEYNHWITNIGEMLSDLLIRDMVASGLYKAVIDMKSSIVPQYEAEGTVEKVYERDDGSDWYSVLQLRCIFFAYNSGKYVLFQRVYRQEVKTAGHEPADIVAALSDAEKNISASVQKDMNEAITNYELVKKQKEEMEKKLGTK